MAKVLEGEDKGVAINAFEPATLDSGLQRLPAFTADPAITDRCVAAAYRHFSLDEGVARCAAIYREMDQP